MREEPGSVLTLSRTNSTFFDGDPDLRPLHSFSDWWLQTIFDNRPKTSISRYLPSGHTSRRRSRKGNDEARPTLSRCVSLQIKDEQADSDVITDISSAYTVTKLAHLEPRHPRRTSRANTLRGIYGLCNIVISQSSPIHASVLGEYMHYCFPSSYECPLTYSQN